MPIRRGFLSLLVFLLSMPVEAELRFKETEEAVTVLMDDKPIAVFQVKSRTPEEDPARLQYLHPLSLPDGRILTENAPDDHIHQRGIFWAWRQLRVGGRQAANSWLLEDILYKPLEHNSVSHADGSITVNSTVIWEVMDPLASDVGTLPIIEEKTAVKVFELDSRALKYVFTIELRALRSDVEVGGAPNSKGYGGFSARLANAESMSFSDMRGRKLNPTPEPVLTKGPIIMHWDHGTKFDDLELSMDCTVNEQPVQSWILRRELSMQNCVWPGREPVKIEMDMPIVLGASLTLKLTRQTPE